MRNNKGFAVTTMLYGLSIMGVLTVVVLMSIMSNNRVNTKSTVKNIEDDLNRQGSRSAVCKGNDVCTYEVPEAGHFRVEMDGANFKSFIVYIAKGAKIYFVPTTTGSANMRLCTTENCASNDDTNVIIEKTSTTEYEYLKSEQYTLETDVPNQTVVLKQENFQAATKIVRGSGTASGSITLVSTAPASYKFPAVTESVVTNRKPDLRVENLPYEKKSGGYGTVEYGLGSYNGEYYYAETYYKEYTGQLDHDDYLIYRLYKCVEVDNSGKPTWSIVYTSGSASGGDGNPPSSSNEYYKAWEATWPNRLDPDHGASDITGTTPASVQPTGTVNKPSTKLEDLPYKDGKLSYTDNYGLGFSDGKYYYAEKYEWATTQTDATYYRLYYWNGSAWILEWQSEDKSKAPAAFTDAWSHRTQSDHGASYWPTNSAEKPTTAGNTNGTPNITPSPSSGSDVSGGSPTSGTRPTTPYSISSGSYGVKDFGYGYYNGKNYAAVKTYNEYTGQLDHDDYYKYILYEWNGTSWSTVYSSGLASSTGSAPSSSNTYYGAWNNAWSHRGNSDHGASYLQGTTSSSSSSSYDDRDCHGATDCR